MQIMKYCLGQNCFARQLLALALPVRLDRAAAGTAGAWPAALWCQQLAPRQPFSGHSAPARPAQLAH